MPFFGSEKVAADMSVHAEARTQETRSFMQKVRVTARRKYTPEEKVRIVLEGFRREVAVSVYSHQKWDNSAFRA